MIEQSDTGEFPEDQPIATSDPDAERSILGGVLLVNESLLDVTDIVRPEDFADVRHETIFRRMTALASANIGIDVVTLADALKEHGEFDSVGGFAYLSSLDANVPTSANLGRYATIVRDKSARRGLLAAAVATVTAARGDERPTTELLAEAETRIFGVRDSGVAFDPVSPVSALLPALLKSHELSFERHSRGEPCAGLATGFDDLDRMTGGFAGGDVVIIGGRPSMGKTAVAMNAAAHVAFDLKLPVVVFSLEMSAQSLMNRLVSSDSRVDGHRIKTGGFLESDWPKLGRSYEKLRQAPLFIRDRPGITTLDMRSDVRRVQKKLGRVGMVVLDYIQLARGLVAKGSNREQEIASISRGLKTLAKEADCPVIALSQLNRSLESRADKRPMMSDLRESGAIEQDADCIVFMYRDEVYERESKDKGIAEAIVAKQRSGATGTVRLAWLGAITRFENLSESHDWQAAPRGDRRSGE